MISGELAPAIMFWIAAKVALSYRFGADCDARTRTCGRQRASRKEKCRRRRQAEAWSRHARRRPKKEAEAEAGRAREAGVAMVATAREGIAGRTSNM